MPPRARTGIFIDWQIKANCSIPIGGPYALLDGVSYTGPQTMKSAPPASAIRASAMECVETPMMKSFIALRATTFWISEIGSDETRR